MKPEVEPQPEWWNTRGLEACSKLGPFPRRRQDCDCCLRLGWDDENIGAQRVVLEIVVKRIGLGINDDVLGFPTWMGELADGDDLERKVSFPALRSLGTGAHDIPSARKLSARASA